MVTGRKREIFVENRLYFVDGRLHVASAHIESHINAPFALIVGNLRWGFTERDVGNLAHRYRASVGKRNLEVPDRFDVGAQVGIHPQHKVKAAVFLVNIPCHFSGKSSFENIIGRCYRNAVAGHSVAVIAHLNLWKSMNFLYLWLGNTLDISDQRGNLVGR